MIVREQISRQVGYQVELQVHLRDFTPTEMAPSIKPRLRKVRPPVYTRSADGFSLCRSGVTMSNLGGRNLKWTKRAGEEVTKAVAEGELKQRKSGEKETVLVQVAAPQMKDERQGEGERIVWVGLVCYKVDAASKSLHRMAHLQGEAGNTHRTASTLTTCRNLVKTSPILTQRRSIIGGSLYLRVGNGNQLVRDLEACEKDRWSLNNTWSLGAKKQTYCKLFTRYGECNKECGCKCSYVHDSDRMAVCTKSLKGNCTNSECLLTDKIIPESNMPDCSFFLKGLCTNENCSYRHVNVNPKAPYCDGFLRGYCKDGDICNKKHAYVCSVYATETSECLDRSTCKFHHPTKKDIKTRAPVISSGKILGTKCKRRYFSTAEPQSTRQRVRLASVGGDCITIEERDAPDGGSMDFISLNNSESDEDQNVLLVQSQTWHRPSLSIRANNVGYPEDIEKWIKPAFLMQMRSPAAVSYCKLVTMISV